MINHRAPKLALAGTALSLLAAACGGSSAAPSTSGAKPADGVSVNTGLLAFNPAVAHIKVGQTVTWVAGDSIKHILVEGTYQVGSDTLRTSQTDDKAFNLVLTKKGQTVSHTYNKPGTFTYYCTIHHGMNGSVIVG